MTFVLCFGKYGGFHIRNTKNAFGICLGWISWTVYFYDIECKLEELLKQTGQL